MFKHIEYLVKPFQDSKDLPVDGCQKILGDPFYAVKQALLVQKINPIQYLDQMLELWKQRVKLVQTDENSLFVTIDIADIYLRYNIQPVKQLLELRDFATTSLGSRYKTFYDSTAAALNLVDTLKSPLTLHAYGEISDRCALGETQNLSETLLKTGHL